MKNAFIFLALLVTSGLAIADDGVRYRIDDHAKYIQGALGFGPGGIALGADYEMGLDQNVSWGGNFRYYPDNIFAGKPKVFYIGAFIRPHWNRSSWDFYTTPGIGLSFASNPKTSEALLTPTIAFGTSYAFTQSLTIGVENMIIYGISSDNFRGNFNDDFMFKMRFRLD